MHGHLVNMCLILPHSHLVSSSFHIAGLSVDLGAVPYWNGPQIDAESTGVQDRVTE